MNILKNMEAVFVATVVLAGTAGYLVDELPAANATTPTAYVSASAPLNSAIVVVAGKRMSVEEKQRSLNEERQQIAAQPHARSST